MLDAVLFASEAPNGWILPGDINEVWWGTSAFLVVAAILWWKALPAAKNMASGRTERIRSELEAAASARARAEAELSEIQARLADADAERARIRAEAQQTAAAVQAQLAARAEQEAAELRARAAADAESSKAQAEADLRAEVGAIAIGAAEAVVARNLDPETQRNLVERYIASVGAAR